MRRRGQDSGKRVKPRHIMRHRTTHADISISKGELAVVPYLEMRAILEGQIKARAEQIGAAQECWLFHGFRYSAPRPIVIGDLP